jgi:hypothetical protein
LSLLLNHDKMRRQDDEFEIRIAITDSANNFKFQKFESDR